MGAYAAFISILVLHVAYSTYYWARTHYFESFKSVPIEVLDHLIKSVGTVGTFTLYSPALQPTVILFTQG